MATEARDPDLEHEIARHDAVERTLRETLRELRAREAIADATTTDEVLDAVLDQAITALRASSAALWLIDPEDDAPRLARAAGDQESRTLPMIVELFESRDGAARSDGSGAVAVALRARGATMGVLSAVRRGHPAFSDGDLRLLEVLAARGAAALDAIRLSSENLEARARAEHLYRFAQAVVTAERVEQVLDAALDAIERALGATRISILTFDTRGVMRFDAWRGLSEDYRRAVEGHSPWSRDAVAPEPILVADVEQDPALASLLPVLQRENIGALAFFPLVTAGRLIGKFMIYDDHPHRYSPQEVGVALSISNHLASVIARFTAVSKLQETIHYNEIFAGVLAHDLRNPLGAIVTASDLLLRRDVDERIVGPIQRIRASAERMTRMIEQILDFTRARIGGGIPIEPAVLDLEALAAQLVEELEGAAPQAIVLEASGDLRGTWDSDRLAQVISNLLGNAVQHGGADQPVRVHLDGADPERVRIAVWNAGALEHAAPTLFDPFRGVRGAAAPRAPRKSKGLGLGLYIVQQLVVAHGGAIDVQSSSDAGTTFIVTLPRTTAAKLGSP